MTTVSLIVAYSRNRVIGKDNQLPWRLPGDLAHFKRNTLGKPIIMGRKTWESLGRPLPGRLNVVVSKSGKGNFEGALLVDSLQAALAATDNVPEVFIIGGAQLYGQALSVADRIVATEIDAVVDGDAFFDQINPSDWVQTTREVQPPENGLTYAFVEYERRK